MSRFSSSDLSRSVVRVSASTAMLALAAGLAGCGAVGSWDKATSDAWAVTYEVTVAGGSGDSLKDVSYLEAEKRGEDSTEVTEDSVATTDDAKKKASSIWSVESMVTAQKDASIAATPAQGGTATCRILLDGVKEIASETGAPGKRVQCEATTPAFKK
ncbi:hypothetical protein [Glutamicibacter halophytocola]|uniref:hypothetical protein n=1 Tax=Glutamicibacter halophytocola TaxID=1933880 RepID=UPI0015C5226A|nr:hypothetical protein [Glutamicibacter halophytocola]NQD42120.1 hypothetical protein [Glutamicibacter halophytocola]